MATYISYHLRIGGRLAREVEQPQQKIADFLTTIGTEMDGDPAAPEGWPQGFVYRGLDTRFKKCEIKEWMAESSPGGEGTTNLSFLALVSTTLPGKLGDNREEIRRFADWFTDYRQRAWYRELVARLQALHGRLNASSGVVEKVWFRDTGVTIHDGGDW
jgi:hypothetical protein